MDQPTITPITTTDLKCREFSVGIFKDTKNRLIVRKSEILHGITIPLYETYCIDIKDAVKIQELLVHEIHNFKLN